MGDLSEHFSRHEFACECGCGMDTVDNQLIWALEELHDAFNNRRITITSGHRCKKHNMAVGGGENSQHLYGRAADVVVEGVEAIDVFMWLSENNGWDLSLGSYPDFTHLDTRSDGGRRW